jgi:transcriptional regulator with XRE-family HTH domain
MRISQEDLAEKAGLHRTYVGSVERAERNVSIDNMDRLAEAVGSTIQQLLES